MLDRWLHIRVSNKMACHTHQETNSYKEERTANDVTHFPKASTAAHARQPPHNATAHGNSTARPAASHIQARGHRSHEVHSISDHEREKP